MDTQTAANDTAATLAAGEEGNQEANDAANQAQAEADFLAGFDSASGREPEARKDDVSTATDDGTNDGTDGGTPAPGTETAATGDDANASTPSTGPLTEERVLELLQQARDEERNRFEDRFRRLDGRYGNLKGRIDELSSRKVLTKEDLADLTAEYEDIGQLIGKNLPDTHQPLPPLTDPDDETQTETADTGGAAAGEAMSEAMQERYLDRLSPGWAPKLQSDAFAQWLATLPAAERDDIANSNDPLRIADEVARFDTWDSSNKQRAQAERNKQSRLSGAETPTRGKTPGGPTTEDPNQAFLDGWRTASGMTG